MTHFENFDELSVWAILKARRNTVWLTILYGLPFLNKGRTGKNVVSFGKSISFFWQKIRLFGKKFYGPWQKI